MKQLSQWETFGAENFLTHPLLQHTLKTDGMTWHNLAVMSVKKTVGWPNGTFAALNTHRHSQVILCSCQVHLHKWATASMLAKYFCCQYTPVYSVMCNTTLLSCRILLEFLISTGVSEFHFSFGSNLAIVLLFLRFLGFWVTTNAKPSLSRASLPIQC